MLCKLFNVLALVALSFTMLSCQIGAKKPSSDTMSVTGKIEGLRKGVLYLQKVVDSLLVNVDSVEIKGNPRFSLSAKVETPEIFYLYLEKEDSDSLNDRILFFGEQGAIEINTRLKTFESSAKIKGSENQELLQEYQLMNRKFNDKNLELLRQLYGSQNDTYQRDSIQKSMEGLLRRRYLYALNFAVRYADKNIAPYIVLTQVHDANLTLLDTVASKMNSTVKTSKYGRQFMEYLEKRHKYEDTD